MYNLRVSPVPEDFSNLRLNTWPHFSLNLHLAPEGPVLRLLFHIRFSIVVLHVFVFIFCVSRFFLAHNIRTSRLLDACICIIYANHARSGTMTMRQREGEKEIRGTLWVIPRMWLSSNYRATWSTRSAAVKSRHGALSLSLSLSLSLCLSVSPSLCLSVSPSLRLSVSLSLRLSISLSLCLSLCLSVCRSLCIQPQRFCFTSQKNTL